MSKATHKRMGRLSKKAKTTNRNYNDEDRHDMFDQRPKRFKRFQGKYARENAELALIDLVNLPSNPDHPKIVEFISDYNDLALGWAVDPADDDPLAAEPMKPEEVVGYRDRYRQFWLGSDSWKSKRFLEFVGPRLEEVINSNSICNKSAEELANFRGNPYRKSDYTRSALVLDWKTGQFRIEARGPIDRLTDVVFRNRNRLRICSNPNCTQAAGARKFFIAKPPYKKNKPCSDACGRENELARKQRWWAKTHPPKPRQITSGFAIK